MATAHTNWRVASKGSHTPTCSPPMRQQATERSLSSSAAGSSKDAAKSLSRTGQKAPVCANALQQQEWLLIWPSKCAAPSGLCTGKKGIAGLSGEVNGSRHCHSPRSHCKRARGRCSQAQSRQLGSLCTSSGSGSTCHYRSKCPITLTR